LKKVSQIVHQKQKKAVVVLPSKTLKQLPQISAPTLKIRAVFSSPIAPTVIDEKTPKLIGKNNKAASRVALTKQFSNARNNIPKHALRTATRSSLKGDLTNSSSDKSYQ
jgi:hypothetical protein